GDRFMELAKSGDIGKICVPNALSTFKEYLIDFASDGTSSVGEEFLNEQISRVNGTTNSKIKKMIERVENGERDVYF
ncbi:MAG: [FeFe] hydrogenase H-cluster radical SAM maturase HydG, partial [Bacteroidota bacterium]|nr:[FeFe] hydrogenase H-cluster radical SAM maturase HydG [Bacteroidota bacterium]